MARVGCASPTLTQLAAIFPDRLAIPIGDLCEPFIPRVPVAAPAPPAEGVAGLARHGGPSDFARRALRGSHCKDQAARRGPPFQQQPPQKNTHTHTEKSERPEEIMARTKVQPKRRDGLFLFLAGRLPVHFSTVFPLERRDMVIDGAAERRLQASHRDRCT